MMAIRGRRLDALAVIALAAIVLPEGVSGQREGFAEARQAAQQRCEARFLELPRPEGFREHLRAITAEPHPTGSAAQARVADYLADALGRAGFEVERHPYDVFLPLLDSIVAEAEIVAPERERLVNREPAVEGDPFSDHPGLLPGGTRTAARAM